MTTSAVKFDHGYFGSKDAGGVAERTIRLYQAHSTYVELYLGQGAIMRRKKPAMQSIGIDCDPEVIERWLHVGYPGLRLIKGQALFWLLECGGQLPDDALVNADPPYVLSTRTSKKRYKFEMTDADHVDLIEALDDLGCSVFLHGYPSKLYDQNPRLKNWRREELPAMTRGGKRTEVIWYRTSMASFFIEARHHGKDFRDRERLKRKIGRWKSKYAGLPIGERAVILQALLEVDSLVTADDISKVMA